MLPQQYFGYQLLDHLSLLLWFSEESRKLFVLPELQIPFLRQWKLCWLRLEGHGLRSPFHIGISYVHVCEINGDENKRGERRMARRQEDLPLKKDRPVWKYALSLQSWRLGGTIRGSLGKLAGAWLSAERRITSRARRKIPCSPTTRRKHFSPLLFPQALWSRREPRH